MLDKSWKIYGKSFKMAGCIFKKHQENPVLLLPAMSIEYIEYIEYIDIYCHIT